MSKDVIIAKNVSKEFLLPHQKKSNLKDHIIHPLNREEKEKQQALHDISFSIKKGEFFGIVGRNGSGKSTLLKILAGVYTPTSGSISVEGNLVPFIELGVGFNPELSGRDNVYLNGSLLGFSRHEMAEMYDEIVEFAELERFMDQKLKNYSSGMQVRLAFSIAIRAKADILLIDEVLAVGDEAFQKKCVDVLRRIREDESKTVVLVTHDMSWIEKFCDRAAVIEKGKLMAVYDNAHEAKNHYSQLNVDHQTDDAVASKRWGGGEITIDQVNLYQQEKVVESQVQCELDLTLSLKLKSHTLKAKDPILIGIGIYTETGQQVFGPNSEGVGLTAAKKQVTFTIPALTFNEGRFFLSVGVFDKSGNTVYDFQDKMMEFKVVRGDQSKQVGLAYLDGEWS